MAVARTTTKVTLVVAAVLFVYGTLGTTPQALMRDTNAALTAAASLSVGVAPNPYNSVAAQLAQKEESLNTREAQLNQEQQGHTLWGIDLSFYSLCMSMFLFVLVAINFFFDVRRTRMQSNRFSVDLR